MLTFRAGIFIGLNVIRAISIISLILVFASSIVTLVHDVEAVNSFMDAGVANSTLHLSGDGDYIADSTVPHQPAGAFWAVTNRLLIIVQVIVLILCEIGWPSIFFERFIPVLGPKFGLGALGVVQTLIGAAVLSHHVDDFALVSSFFVFVIGCINIFLGLIFHERIRSRRSITAWRERARDVLPPVSVAGRSVDVVRTAEAFGAYIHEKRSEASTPGPYSVMSEKSGYGFGTAGEKQAGLKGFMLSRPVEAAPRYHSATQ